MTDKKLTDSEIVKEIQGIKESMKRHIDLTNEMGQDLLRIDEEYTGGSKVWLTTDYFKKVVKHFCHSNYLVKCLELVFGYVNRLQAENEAYKHYYNECLKDLENAHVENEKLKEEKDEYAYLYDKHINTAFSHIKAEAYKECIEKVKDEKFKTSVDAYTDAYILGEDDLDNLLKEMVGDK